MDDVLEVEEYSCNRLPRSAIKPTLNKRQKVIKEVFDTEETYLFHLKLIVKNFQSPLKKLKLVPEYVISEIFQNIDQIISLNKELMELLSQHSMGEAFLRVSQFFKFYSLYANNHEYALATLLNWEQKCPDLSAFRRTQEGLPEMNGLKLNALLITPVQRVPRYKLLLTELLKQTENDNPDYENIKKAVAEMSKVADHINNHIKQQDNAQKMIAIQKSLCGTSVPQLVQPGRIFLKEGDLKKVSRKGGKAHDRKCSCILPLRHCKVERLLGHSQSQATLFAISCQDERLLLYSDHKTVESWIKALHETINSLEESRMTLRKPSSTRTPLRGLALMKQIKLEQRQSPTISPTKETIFSTLNFTENQTLDCFLMPFRKRSKRL
ncbi:DgyrCDS9608 [Dimorphilus gyrociliatus]|uniref:DgyrCDS9608 n=1 Tax=Dimorphilus gyrociliatus TaxID=2664684 RepID=A0A7I8VYW5_9ANNE|nr:DgyrCDS9608 [Dimorphilus gyrociliatus]